MKFNIIYACVGHDQLYTDADMHSSLVVLFFLFHILIHSHENWEKKKFLIYEDFLYLSNWVIAIFL